jgi:hypothetical protein
MVMCRRPAVDPTELPLVLELALVLLWWQLLSLQLCTIDDVRITRRRMLKIE